MMSSDGEMKSKKVGARDVIYKNDTGGAATPSFYVEIAGQKVAVISIKQTKTTLRGRWTRLPLRSLQTPISTGKDRRRDSMLEDAYGVSITGEDLDEASNVYLNASESDIEDLLYAASGENELDDVMECKRLRLRVLHAGQGHDRGRW